LGEVGAETEEVLDVGVLDAPSPDVPDSEALLDLSSMELEPLDSRLEPLDIEALDALRSEVEVPDTAPSQDLSTIVLDSELEPLDLGALDVLRSEVEIPDADPLQDLLDTELESSDVNAQDVLHSEAEIPDAGSPSDLSDSESDINSEDSVDQGDGSDREDVGGA